MRDFLADPGRGTYLIVAILVIIAWGLWLRRRGRIALGIAIAVSLLLLGLFIADRMIESSEEQVLRKTAEISDAINARDLAKFNANLSDHFNKYTAGLKKPEMAKLMELANQNGARVAVWDVKFAGRVDGLSPEGKSERLQVEFKAKVELAAGGQGFKYVRAYFIKDPDGQYRLDSISGFNYVKNDDPEPIPILQ